MCTAEYVHQWQLRACTKWCTLQQTERLREWLLQRRRVLQHGLHRPLRGL
jgi:hypothetical protein